MSTMQKEKKKKEKGKTESRMFIICDKDPQKAAMYFAENAPNTLVIKQLSEIAQMVCRLGYSNLFKKSVAVSQDFDKKQLLWIKGHRTFTKIYFDTLLKYLTKNLKYKDEAYGRFLCLSQDLSLFITKTKKKPPKTIIFQRNKFYEPKRFRRKEVEVSIEKGIELNKKYLPWLVKHNEQILLQRIQKCVQTIERIHENRRIVWKDLKNLLNNIKYLIEDNLDTDIQLRYSLMERRYK